MSPVFTTDGPTLAELRTDVEARGYAASTPGLDSAINSAYREVLAARRWEFLETVSQALTIPAGSSSVTLAGIADLLHVDAVRLDGAVASDPELDWWPDQKLRRALQRDSSTGQPCAWTRRGGELYVYPTPDQDYVLTIDYVASQPELVADTDVAQLPRAYKDAIIWGAVVALAFRQRDAAAVQMASNFREAAVQRMVRAYGLHQRQTSDQMQSNPSRWNSWNYRNTGF